MFGLVIYYYNPSNLKKFVYNIIAKGILIEYKSDIICYILKPNGRIVYSATVYIVKQII